VRLAGFELRRGRIRSEHRDPGRSQTIRDPVRERNLRPDDDEVDALTLGEFEYPLGVIRRHVREAFGHVRHPVAARRREHLRNQRTACDLPGQRVLAPPGP